MSDPSLPPTTRQIAKVAGVSHVTVSRVLRNEQFVTEETKKRVWDAANELGYRPNPLVSILMHQLRSRKKTDFVATLGWINSHENQNEWSECPWRRIFYNGAKDRARQLGYALDNFWMAEKGMSPQRMRVILRSRNIHGLIIPPATDFSLLTQSDSSDLCAVFIGQPESHLNYSFVDADTSLSMIKAIEALRAYGYRRIGLVLAPSQNPPGHGWRATFLSLQEDWPQKERLAPLRLKDTLANCQNAYTSWLKKYKPDAVIGCDILLKDFAEKAGFSVPEQMGIAHLHLADDVRGWSGIDTNDISMGSTAVDVVAATLQRNELGPTPVPRRILIPPTWVEGKTTRILERK